MAPPTEPADRRERGRLPIVPLEERRRILELPPTGANHRELLRRMPFMDAVELHGAGSGAAGPAAGGVPARIGGPRPAGAPRQAVEPLTAPIRIVAWNLARCTDVEATARVIEEAGADVVLLTEMDWGMARSGQLHTTRELAERLGFAYAYAVEFLELGLGDERERAAFAEQENLVGYHGGALLARGRLTRVRRIALEEQGGWFGPERGQRRVGGRMALAAIVQAAATKARPARAEIDGSAPEPGVPPAGTPERAAAAGQAAASELVVCSVHLESESDPAERAREMELLFDRLDAEYPGRPVIIGGDLNTFSVSKRELDDPAERMRRFAEDPRRYVHPVPYEPLFADAERRGYDWRECNALRLATHRGEEDPNPHGSLKLDWFLCRGVRTREPRVLRTARTFGERELSDHAPIDLVAEV